MDLHGAPLAPHADPVEALAALLRRAGALRWAHDRPRPPGRGRERPAAGQGADPARPRHRARPRRRLRAADRPAARRSLPVPRRSPVRGPAHAALPAPRPRLAAGRSGRAPAAGRRGPARPVRPRLGRRRDRAGRSNCWSACRSSSTRRWTGSTPTRSAPQRPRRTPPASRSRRTRSGSRTWPARRRSSAWSTASSAVRSRPLASDIHIEPFEDRLRVRYRYDGVLHEAESPAAAAHRRDHLARQDHGPARHRRAPAAAGRPHQDGRARPGGRFPRLHRPVALRRERRAPRARPQRGQLRIRQAGPARPGHRPPGGGARSCRTGSCWSPAPPAAARPRRSTPACSRSTRWSARSSPSRTRSNTSFRASTRSRSSRRSGSTSPACSAPSCARTPT